VLKVLTTSDPAIAALQDKIDVPATFTNQFVDHATVKQP